GIASSWWKSCRKIREKLSSAPTRPHSPTPPLAAAANSSTTAASPAEGPSAPLGGAKTKDFFLVCHFSGESVEFRFEVQQCISEHGNLYTSQVRYGSERRFIAAVFLPQGLRVAGCSQSVLCVPDCSWRRYRSEVRLQPRHRPQRFACTTIVYPKHARTVCTTTLDYNCRKAARRFLASVELESSESPG
ncbi:RFLB protein, partial [Oenanthe oenanthe]|nr:RFLB protein [Oenanthe oenanthe]